MCCLLDSNLCLPFCFKPTTICFGIRMFTVIVPFDYLSDCTNNLLRVTCLGSLSVFPENKMTWENFFLPNLRSLPIDSQNIKRMPWKLQYSAKWTHLITSPIKVVYLSDLFIKLLFHCRWHFIQNVRVAQCTEIPKLELSTLDRTCIILLLWNISLRYFVFIYAVEYLFKEAKMWFAFFYVPFV